MKLMNRLGYIHHLGVTHGDFREPNVLNNNGVPFIVDFEHAGDHRCRYVREMAAWGSLKPYPSEFNCDELYDLGINLQVWMNSKSCIISFFMFAADLIL